MATSSSYTLRRQLTELNKRPVEGFSAGLVNEDDIYIWDVTLFGPPDSLYDGAFLKAVMTFPKDYPLNPPELKFKTTMWHPNIYPDGRTCISILHPPGDDPMNPFESAGERWMPVHTIESILVSVISLLSADTPATESPANVDAAKEVRTDIVNYRKKVRRLARRSAEEAFD